MKKNILSEEAQSLLWLIIQNKRYQQKIMPFMFINECGFNKETLKQAFSELSGKNLIKHGQLTKQAFKVYDEMNSRNNSLLEDDLGYKLYEACSLKPLSVVIEITKKILEKNIDINDIDFEELGADGNMLMHTINKQRFEISDFLLNLNIINLRETNSHGLTVLHYAAKVNNKRIMSEIIKRECKFDYDNVLGWYCESYRLPHMVETLISYGADLNSTPEGLPMLHHASYGGNSKIIKYLVKEKHISPNSVDDENRTPLHISCLYSKVKAIEGLISLGADINAKDSLGNTPIMALCQAKRAYFSTFILLIKAGADLSCVNSNNQTLLMIAQENQKHQIIEYLEQTL